LKLIAGLIVKNEMRRYLPLAVDSLLEFVDEIRVLDDMSTDGSYDYLLGKERVSVLTNTGPTFFEHEGKARQALLNWTLEAEPTHILAIDADEFVSDGAALRSYLEGPGQVFTLVMEEVWKADENLWIRHDGGWRAHPVPILYAVPQSRSHDWQIMDRALACGREPLAVRRLAGRAVNLPISVLHFGWTDESNRQARYQRYVEHDNGNFHAKRHLDSIMWDDRQVQLRVREWPPSLTALRESLT